MPKLLDAFSGAGGCSVGYARAGFTVTGVDIEPHDDYPFDLIVADAMDKLTDRSFLSRFDVAHASPPAPPTPNRSGTTPRREPSTPSSSALFVRPSKRGAARM